MNLLFSILVAILFLLVLPTVCGQLWKNVIRDGDVILTYIGGFFTELAMFELIGPAMIVLSLPANAQVVVESVVLVVFACFALVLCRNKIKNSVKQISVSAMFPQLKKPFMLLLKHERLYLTLFIVLLLTQVYFAVCYDISGWRSDDYLYTVVSSSAIYDNHYFATDFTSGNWTYGINPKYAFCGIYSFFTYTSAITGLNPSVIEHTVCAVFFLLMAYGVFYLLSKLLFPKEGDREKRLLFLIFLSLIFLFGLYSHYSVSFRLFGVIWQGKAFLAVVSIPFLLAIYPRLLEGQYGYKQMLYCAMISLATISLTMMGVIAMVVIPGILTLLHMIRTKSLRSISLLISSEIFPAIMVVAYLLYT